MEERIGEVARRLDGTDKTLSPVDGRNARIDMGLDVFDTGLRQLILSNHEEIKNLLQNLGELMAAGFTRIDRRFDAMERHWQGKWSDHDRASSNHSRRIGALERSRK